MTTACPTCGAPVDWSEGAVIDFATNTAILDGRAVKLLPREADVLFVLAERMPRTVSVDELNHAYAPSLDLKSNTLRQYVFTLRRKLKGHAYRIDWVWRRGYRLVKNA